MCGTEDNALISNANTDSYSTKRVNDTLQANWHAAARLSNVPAGCPHALRIITIATNRIAVNGTHERAIN